MSAARTLLHILSLGAWKIAGMFVSVGVAVGMANVFGASAGTDAYFLARRITSNLAMGLDRMVALLLVPEVVRVARVEGAAALRRSLGGKTLRILVISLAGSVLAFVWAEQIIRAVGPGFDEARTQEAAFYLRILLVAIPISAMTALTGAALNGLRLFSVPEVARLLPRLFTIAALIWGATRLGLTLIAASVVVGAVCMGLVLAVQVHRALRRLSGTPDIGDGPARGRIAGARLVAMLVVQAHMIGASWVNLAFASTTGVGGVSVLGFGQRLVSMLPGAATTSVVVVYYTELADAAVSGDRQRFRELIATSIRTSLFFVAPIAVTLFLLSDRIVEVLLAHGAFSAAAAETTAAIMAILAPLLLVNAVLGCLVSALFADAEAPHLRLVGLSTLLAMGARIGVDVLLVDRIGVIAVPMGALAGVTVLLIALYAMMASRMRGILSLADAGEVARTLVAAAACGAAVLGAGTFLPPMEARLAEIAALAALAVTGGVAYLIAAAVLRIETVDTLRAAVMRRIARIRRRRDVAGGA